MMAHRSLMKNIVFIVVLILAACAPENLDITPTPVPTPIPTIKVYVTGAVNQTGTTIELPLGSRISDAIEAAGGVLDTADLQRVNMAQLLRDGDQVNVPAVGDVIAEATPEATAQIVVSDNQQLLDHLIAGIPPQINAGSQWQQGLATECTQNREVIVYREVEAGLTVNICFGERGGGLSYLIMGVFDSPEAAATYYQSVLERTRTLERAEERESFSNYEFPKPNAFGGGTYGSDAIFVRDNIFVQVSVPRFSSTSGDPLSPMSRAVFTAVDAALASFTPSE